MATERTSVLTISIFKVINSTHFIAVILLKGKKLVLKIEISERKNVHRRHIRKISKSQTNEKRRLFSVLIGINPAHSFLSFRTV